MKKTWITTWIFMGMIILFLPALAWSQTQYQSLQSQTSFGLFENAFDAAFNPTDAKPVPTFSTLEQNYFFGGLTNFSELPNTYSFTMVPLRLGYYHAGSMPWSGLSDILVDTTSSTRSNGITPSTATKPVTVGTTTTNYKWVTQETDNQYDRLEAWNTALGGQFLIGLGFVNTGLGVRWDYEQNASGAAINTWADANRTITDTYYYDPTAGTVAPSPIADYSRTITNSMPDTDSTIYLQVPVYTELFGIKMTAAFTAAFNSRDQSVTNGEQEFTAPQQPGAGSFNGVVVANSTTDKTGYTDIDADIILTFAPLLGNHANNRLELGVNGGFMKNKADTYEMVFATQDYDYAGSGAPLTPVNNGSMTDQSTTTKRDGTTGYDVNVSAQHYLYWDIGAPLTLGIAPKLQVGIAYTPPVSTYSKESVSVVKSDLTGNGVYTDAGDLVATTTTTYSNNDDGGNSDIVDSITLPSALRFKPERWPIGITFGNELGVSFTARTVKDKSTTTQTTVQTADGTGTVTGTTTTTAGDSYTSKSFTTVWSFTSDYQFALNFFLSKNATLDVVLDQFSGAFALYAQAIIALP